VDFYYEIFIINTIKRDFVSLQQFTDTMDTMNNTVQNIQVEIREGRKENREQSAALFALLNRRRDGD